MKKYCLLFLSFSVIINVFAQSAKNTVSIIPEPVKISLQTGEYILPKRIAIYAGSNGGIQKTVLLLKNKLTRATGYPVNITNNPVQAATIKLLLLAKADAELGKEGYSLAVDAKGIIIKANEAAGLFYGVQSLIQLLPAQIESKELAGSVQWTVPFVEIIDYPRFGWRGLMLDVSRHFFTKEEVKQYIDQMASYKFNLLHMHLTDDEGWRIEIKSLPRLTTVGAYNVKKIGEFGSFSAPDPSETP